VINIEKLNEQLLLWMAKVCPQDDLKWLKEKQDEIQKSKNPHLLYLAFTEVPRIIEKTKLKISEDDIKIAGELRPKWNPATLSTHQVARISLLVSLPAPDSEKYVAAIAKLFSTADLNEQITLYTALPLLPHPENFLPIAYEGARSNITSVFDTIAINNPYPCEYFSDDAFNRMVLKAAFMGRPFMNIIGLEEHSNSTLATMFIDLIHERWAAGRTFSPLLWKLTAPFLNENIYNKLKDKIQNQDELMKSAITLACLESGIPLRRPIEEKKLTWESINYEWEKTEK